MLSGEEDLNADTREGRRRNQTNFDENLLKLEQKVLQGRQCIQKLKRDKNSEKHEELK